MANYGTATAKYHGKCGRCGERHIKPGDPISTARSGDFGIWGGFNCGQNLDQLINNRPRPEESAMKQYDSFKRNQKPIPAWCGVEEFY